jgi:hypothetical protein
MKGISLFFGSGLLLAGSALAAGPTTHTRTLAIAGSAATASGGNVDTSGACNVDPWVDQCSQASGCECVEITVSKASASMDKGTQTVTNFFVTTDQNINAATEPTVSPGPDQKCTPFRGILTDTASSTGESKTLNLLGTSCRKITGITSSNPQGVHAGDVLVGGWGISNSTAPNPDASGSGTFTGSDVKSSGAVSIKLSGLVTE